MLKEYRADLHIHTCLSPCGSLDMSPRAIVREAKKKGIEIIAICDHNSAENVLPVQKIGEVEGVTVLAGMEVTSQEEVHLLTLFNDVEGVNRLQEIVYEHLLPGENDEEAFGPQVIVNEEDEVIGMNMRLLIGATTLSINELVDRAQKLGSVVIASHVDRESFSLLGHMGFIPHDLKLTALEISPHITAEQARARFLQMSGYPLVTFSDAHTLEDIGKVSTRFFLEEPTLKEIEKALRGEEGRRIVG
jgi:hypothetical protein